MKIEDLKIWAYLAPHPLDEDGDFEPEFIEWLPGFINEDDEEEGTIALFREENITLYKKIEDLTEKHFRKAINTMWPLLSNIYIHSIQIAIDVSGILGSTNTSAAAYLYDKSNILKGKYVFQLDMSLLETYLKYDLENSELPFSQNSIWEHEIIHLLDHKNILTASIYKQSTSPFENFKYYLLKFREEGIADLYYELHAKSKISNIDDAISEFLKIVTEKKASIDFSKPTNDKFQKELFDGNDFYRLGPWIILDMLKKFEGMWHEELINECLNKISNKEHVEIDKIIEVIKIALRIDPRSFLFHVENILGKDFVGLI